MIKIVFVALAFFAVSMMSGCSVKVPQSGPTCIGCEGLPECVPGPYGDCLPKK